MPKFGDKRMLQNLVAVAVLRHHRKALTLQRETSACREYEMILAARREKLRVMAADIAMFREDYLQRLLNRGEGRELLFRSIESLIQHRAMEIFKAVDDQTRVAQAKARLQQAAHQWLIEEERLKQHRRALRDWLITEADQQEEWDVE